MKQINAVLVSCLILGGCGAYRQNGGVIVDRSGVEPAQYEHDLKECRAYAFEVPVGEKAATGAAVGAAVGGALGAVSGHRVLRSAGVGAVAGGAHEAIDATVEQERVIKNCMRGRGYPVLN